MLAARPAFDCVVIFGENLTFSFVDRAARFAALVTQFLTGRSDCYLETIPTSAMCVSLAYVRHAVPFPSSASISFHVFKMAVLSV